MSDSNKVLVYLIGLIFLVLGSATALEMVNISFSSLVLLIIGIAFVIMFVKLRNNIFKYLACFFIPIGISYFIISSFAVSDSVNFLLLYFSIACSFLCLYLTSKKKVFLYITLAIALFAMHVYANAHPTMSGCILGFDCLFVATLAVVVFVLEYKSIGYIPLGVSIVAYLGGLLNLLNAYNIISLTIYKLLISLILVAAGLFVICYATVISKKNTKENSYE